MIKCIDCGKEFTVDAKVKKKYRCDECQLIHNREYERQKKQRQRKK